MQVNTSKLGMNPSQPPSLKLKFKTLGKDYIASKTSKLGLEKSGSVNSVGSKKGILLKIKKKGLNGQYNTSSQPKLTNV